MPLHDPAHAFVPYPEAPVPHAATGPLAGLRFGVKDVAVDEVAWCLLGTDLRPQP